MNLTKTAALTKRLILFGSIFLVIGIIGWFGYRYYYYNVYLPSLPPPEEKADPKFGKLPQLALPESSASATNYSYALDTETGELPDKIPKIMKVFFAHQRSISLLDTDRSSELAKKLLFPDGPEIVTPTVFKYTDPPGGEFVIDLDTGNFTFNRKVATASATIGNLPQASKIESEFLDYLNNKGLMKGEFTRDRVKAVYDQGLLKDSSSATVSIWLTDIDSFPIVNPSYDKSIVRQTIRAGSLEEEKVVSMSYTFWKIDEKIFATYPLKPISKAFEELKTGQSGALIITPKTARVSLRKVYLAYYQPEEYVQYVQPVYVFEGENFVAYVPAIQSEFSE